MRNEWDWGWRTRRAVGNAAAIYLGLSDETAELMDSLAHDSRTADKHFVACRELLLQRETRRELRVLRRSQRVLDYRLPGLIHRMDAFVIDHYSNGRRFSDLEWGPFIRAFVPKVVR